MPSRHAVRAAMALCAVVFALTSSAQFQTPVVNGVISPGEYANSSGNWRMTWNDTHLFIANTSTGQNAVVIYLDVDPRPTPLSGGNANGNEIGTSDVRAGTTTPFQAFLPFEADVRSHSGLSVSESLLGRDGTGGWISVSTGSNDLLVSGTGDARQEIRIRWAAIPGLSGRPASFRWFGYMLSDGGGFTTAASSPIPTANPTGAGPLYMPYFFQVDSTADGASTNPFSVQESTWKVTSNAASGAGTFAQAISDANADAGSLRRFITFELSSLDINLTSSLAAITRTTTIDGTTQTGWTSTPIVQLIGPGGTSADALTFTSAANCEVKGLEITAFNHAIQATGSSGLKIGTTAEGNEIAGNEHAITVANPGGLEIRGNSIYETQNDPLEITGFVQPTPVVDLAVENGTNLTLFVSATSINSSATTQSMRLDLYDADPDDLSPAEPKTYRASSPCFAGGSLDEQSWFAGSGFSVSDDLTLIVTSYSDASCTTAADGSSLPANTFSPTDTPVATTTTLASSLPGGAALGENVTFTATISSLWSGITGTVAFTDGGTPISGCESVIVTSSEAQCTTSFATTGAHTIEATYSGDSAHEGSDDSFSQFVDPAPTTTNLTGPSSSWSGVSVTFTATVSSAHPGISGTVTFTDNGAPISGCNALTVAVGPVQCLTKFQVDGEHTITATYSGDATHAVSTDDLTHTVATHVFTGTGPNGSGFFSDASQWSASAIPQASENMIINGTCAIMSAPGITFGNVHLNADASMVTASGVTFRIGSITGDNGSAFNMNNGGTLELSGSFITTLLRGTGTVRLTGTGQALPPLEYHALEIAGAASITSAAGTAVVHESLTIDGDFAPGGGTVELHDAASLSASGNVQFASLTIAAGATISSALGFGVNGIFAVNGTFTPAQNVLVAGTGTLSGTGTLRVTGTGLSAQYILNTYDLSGLTVEFAGTVAQSWDGNNFHHVIINNTVGVNVGTVTLDATGTLNLAAGVAGLGSGTITILNPSSSAVIANGGWIHAALERKLAAGTNVYAYPIGTAATPTPVTVTTTAPNASHALKIQNLAGEHPQVVSSGITSSRNVNFYLDVSSATFTGTADLTMTYGGLVDAGASPLHFVMRRWNGSAWSDVPASPASTSISAYELAMSANHAYFIAGNNTLDHYEVSAPSPQTLDTPFTTTVTARDKFDVTVSDDNTTPVTMSGTSLQYDANGNGVFNDRTKTLTNGTFTISTKATSKGALTIAATDGNGKSGSGTVFVPYETTTTVTSFVNPLPFGQDAPLSITVNSAGPGLSGTVHIKDGETTIGSASVNTGVVTFFSAPLSLGTHAITAVFEETALFLSSTSAPHIVTVVLATPASFSATANGTSSVSLTWAAVTGATSYEIYRNGALFNSTPTPSFNDLAVNANTSYVYQVRAVAGEHTSAFTAPDVATTTVFTGASLSGALVKTVHIHELRTAVNAMRAAAGLGAATFTDGTLTAGTTMIKRVHITELRAALDPARAALGLGAIAYTDPDITAQVTTVKAAHVMDLRLGTQ